MLRLFAGLLILTLLCICGCAHLQTPPETGYRALYDHSAGVSESAIGMHRLGLEKMVLCNYASAERAFRECLAIDSGFGNAHNSLGKLLYNQGKFYAAAWEFDEARHLMPDRPEPSNNLGLVYERVGRFNEAIANFEIASGMEPENPEYLGNLVRARIKRGDKTDDVKQLLNDLVLIETRPKWREWAERQLNTRLSQSRKNANESSAGMPEFSRQDQPALEEVDAFMQGAETLPAPVPQAR